MPVRFILSVRSDRETEQAQGQEEKRPDDVELLLDGKRPGVEQWVVARGEVVDGPARERDVAGVEPDPACDIGNRRAVDRRIEPEDGA